MKKAVIFDAARRAALETFLPDAAAKVTAAGDAVRASFPALTWNTLFVWVLCCEKAAADDLCRQVLEDAASAAGLSCDWDERHPSEETRINRKLVELQARQTLAALRGLYHLAGLETFLRAGVLRIGSNGETITAQDAAARLDDFCTLNAETKEQAAFVAAWERTQRAALELQAAYTDLCASAQDAAARAELESRAGDYDAAELWAGSYYLTAQDAAARALISYFDLSGKTDAAPKFYNLAGVLAYTGKDAAQVIGRQQTFTHLEQYARYRVLYEKPKSRRQSVAVYPAIIVEG